MLNQLTRITSGRTRSISSENRTGKPGAGGTESPPFDANGNPMGPARHLGRGWKVHPFDDIHPGGVMTLAEIEGPGCINHIWMTTALVANREAILRIYWDEQEHPSVECPLGDFFASAYTSYEVFAQLNSIPVCVNPGNAFNCYWAMPFRERCRITLENRHPTRDLRLYYQIDYELREVDLDQAYFHAQFRRVPALEPKRIYTILDGVTGSGHFVGTYLAWQVNSTGWWGEGEVKFYLDNDLPPDLPVAEVVAEHGGSAFPTICGTGTEDYFCGSYNFENKETRSYQEFSTAHAGMPHVVRPDGVYQSQTRFSLYRWHLTDPIRFEHRFAATLQALGWYHDEQRFLPLRDDIASVAYWYQSLPTAPFPAFPERDALIIC